MFAVVYIEPRDGGRRCSTPRSASTSRAWSTAARSSSGARRWWRGTRSRPRPRSRTSPSAAAWRFFVFETRSTNQDGETVCTGTWTNIVRGAELEPGQALPELKVTPDKYLTVRYAGASGDFNPIHIDEEFAQSVGLPGRILHGLWTMAQVARAADRGRAAARRRCAPLGPVPRHGLPRAGDRRCTVDRARGRRRRRRRSSRPRRARAAPASSATRQAELELGWHAASTIDGMLTPRQELLLAQGGRRLRRDRSARGLQGARLRRRRSTAGPSTIRNELAVLEELGLLAHPHTSAGRVPTDAGYRYFVDRMLPPAAARRPSSRASSSSTLAAPRGRRGDARDHRDAVAGDEPAGDRLRAADRRPPRSATSRSCCSSRRS